MAFVAVLLCILLLIVLISVCRFNAFLAFLLVALVAGVWLGLPVQAISLSIQHGIGEALGALVPVICLGAMLGRLVAESGAAQKIAMVLVNAFGKKYLQWALMVTGFVIGIPLFYGVGFVLMVPLVFSIVYQYRLPAVYTGLPMLAALSVTHGFLPPHPSPTALAVQFGADVGLTLLLGLLVSIPAIILAGPVFARTTRHIVSQPLAVFMPSPREESSPLPGTFISFATALLPVMLLLLHTALTYLLRGPKGGVAAGWSFIGEPGNVLLLSVLVAACTLGLRMGKKMKNVMAVYADAIKDVGMILLIIAGAGALKQVLYDSGVSSRLAALLQTLPLQPLVLAWLMAAAIRICIGSATIAGLTTAGIVLPLMQQQQVHPSLMVLSIGAGSLMFSHVNDAGFWMFKEYFNLTIKQTFITWTLMETIVAFAGLAGVLLLHIWF